MMFSGVSGIGSGILCLTGQPRGLGAGLVMTSSYETPGTLVMICQKFNDMNKAIVHNDWYQQFRHSQI